MAYKIKNNSIKSFKRQNSKSQTSKSQTPISPKKTNPLLDIYFTSKISPTFFKSYIK